MRRFLRATAALTVFAFLAGQAVVWLGNGHPSVADDAACGTGIAAGHSSTQFEEVLPVAPLDHCTFCHWQRAMGSARLVAAAHVAIGRDAGDHGAPRPSRLLLTPRSSRVSRGPPSFFA